MMNIFLLVFLLICGTANATITNTYVLNVKDASANPPTMQKGSIIDTGTASGFGNVGIGSATPGAQLDVNGTIRAVAYVNLPVFPAVTNGRLTLTSGVPNSSSDVTGATSIYFTPYQGSHISLYTSSVWKDYTFSEITIALGTLTSGSIYDIFAYDSGGVVTMKIGPAWSSATARGTGAGTTELTTQDGIYVNANSITSGPGAKAGKYIGSFKTTATTTTESSQLNRYVWNNYNRLNSSLRIADATNHSVINNNYTWQYWNSNSADKVQFIAGLSEDAVSTAVAGEIQVNSGTTPYGYIIASVDYVTPSTLPSVYVAGAIGLTLSDVFTGGTAVFFPAIGYHVIGMLEGSSGTANITMWQCQVTALISN